MTDQAVLKMMIHSIYVIIIGILFIPTFGNIQCGTGYTRFGSNCFLLSARNGDWAWAKRHCVMELGVIAEANISSIHTLLQNLMNQRNGTVAWIGSTRQRYDYQWRWNSSNTRINDGFNRWAPGQPSFTTPNTNCLEMVKRNDSNFYWQGASCQKNNPVICKQIYGITYRV